MPVQWIRPDRGLRAWGGGHFDPDGSEGVTAYHQTCNCPRSWGTRTYMNIMIITSQALTEKAHHGLSIAIQLLSSA